MRNRNPFKHQTLNPKPGDLPAEDAEAPARTTLELSKRHGLLLDSFGMAGLSGNGNSTDVILAQRIVSAIKMRNVACLWGVLPHRGSGDRLLHV